MKVLSVTYLSLVRLLLEINLFLVLCVLTMTTIIIVFLFNLWLHFLLHQDPFLNVEWDYRIKRHECWVVLQSTWLRWQLYHAEFLTLHNLEVGLTKRRTREVWAKAVRQQLGLLLGELCCQKLRYLAGSRLSPLFSWPLGTQPFFLSLGPVAGQWSETSHLYLGILIGSGLPEVSPQIPFSMSTSVSLICSALHSPQCLRIGQ